MDDLGDLGFWLAVGIVIAATIVAGALKERAKESERQATIREMMRLEAEGKLTPETFKYLREKDEAERLAAEQVARDMKGGDWVVPGFLAFIVGVLSFVVGLVILPLVIRLAGGPTAVSLLIGIPAMLAVWVGGLRLAVLTYRALRGRKKAPPSGA
jgi:hypothetical protein